jgi:hypothetical protein
LERSRGSRRRRQVQRRQDVVLEERLQISCSVSNALDKEILDQVALKELLVTWAKLSATLNTRVVDALAEQAVGVSLARNSASTEEDTLNVTSSRVGETLRVGALEGEATVLSDELGNTVAVEILSVAIGTVRCELIDPVARLLELRDTRCCDGT